MKQQLSEENVNALVSYRLSRAKETLAEVPHLRDMGYLIQQLIDCIMLVIMLWWLC